MIPASSKFLPALGAFSANYSLGIYDFGADVGNQNFQLLRVYPNRLYCIDVLNNSANVAQSEYVTGFDTTRPVSITFGLKNTNPLLYGRSYPLPNYLVNNRVRSFFMTDQQTDWLVGTLTGVIQQTPGMVGIPQIRQVVSLNIFEITDAEFISKYLQRGNEPGHMVSVPEELNERV